MKSVKKFVVPLIFSMVSLFVLCTIQGDNGSLVPTSPQKTIGPDTTQKVSVPPIIVVTPDSSYIGIHETLGVAITIMQDSTLSHTLPKTRVICSATQGWVSAETLVTDSKGRAFLKISDTTKRRIEVSIRCFSVTQKIVIDVTDTPEKIQKQMKIFQSRAILSADGKDTTSIRVTLTNATNNPISNQCVQFITSSGVIMGEKGSCTGAGQSETDETGTAWAHLTSANINDTAFITAFLITDKLQTVQTKVLFRGVKIQLHADSVNLKPGKEGRITAILLNGAGEPIPYSPIFFSTGKGSQSTIAIISKDSLTGPEGNAQCQVKGSQNETDSITVSAAGATASLRINVTDLSLSISLDDKIIQARETKSTLLHIVFTSSSGTVLSGKNVQIKRTYKTGNDEKAVDTSDYIFATTDNLGKCAIVINALPYESLMNLEVTAFNSATSLASSATSISFIATRTMIINAIPTIVQADGTSKSTITVQIKNEENNPIVADKIGFTTDAGLITASATTDDNGKAVVFLTGDRRNTVATIKATLLKDPTKFVTVKVEFTGVELTASINPPSISSAGKDSSLLTITLMDAAKNPIVGEPVTFSKLQDNTHITLLDSVTNNRGEARCKVNGTGKGLDTIKVEAAGATAKAGISYSSNKLAIDTASYQPCIANGKDSTILAITYMQGDGSPITNATLDVSITLGSMSSAPVFTKRITLIPADNGKVSFYMKNPGFANTATIFVNATTSSEITSATYQLYFKANSIRRIVLTGTPEVVASNGSKAKITAVAYDSLGNRVKDARISFNLVNGPGGGEHLDPPTAITAADGSAITYLVTGSIPSMFRQVWVTSGDVSSIKSDTLKFTIAGPPHAITIRQNILEGTDYKDGTFGLPCAAIVTDVNGNPVADGTEVTFSCKVSGWVLKRPTATFTPVSGTSSYTVQIDTAFEILPFEDLNDNYRCDANEDLNGDSVASRGEDIDGDGVFTIGPPFIDINHNGRRDYLPGDIVEPWRYGKTMQDTSGKSFQEIVFADFNGNGYLDTYEPLTGWAASMTDSTYTSGLTAYKLLHHGKGYDIDTDPKNGVADPQTAVSITRTVQTTGGKAPNNILYGQADAWHVEIMVWAESQGVKTLSPAQLILPVIGKK